MSPFHLGYTQSKALKFRNVQPWDKGPGTKMGIATQSADFSTIGIWLLLNCASAENALSVFLPKRPNTVNSTMRALTNRPTHRNMYTQTGPILYLREWVYLLIVLWCLYSDQDNCWASSEPGFWINTSKKYRKTLNPYTINPTVDTLSDHKVIIPVIIIKWPSCENGMINLPNSHPKTKPNVGVSVGWVYRSHLMVTKIFICKFQEAYYICIRFCSYEFRTCTVKYYESIWVCDEMGWLIDEDFLCSWPGSKTRQMLIQKLCHGSKYPSHSGGGNFKDIC